MHYAITHSAKYNLLYKKTSGRGVILALQYYILKSGLSSSGEYSVHGVYIHTAI